MPTIEEYYTEFRDEADIRAQSDGDYLNAAFFEMFAETAEDNGDVEMLDYTPYIRAGLQIDGYHLDFDAGVLTIAVADFRPDRELQSLNTNEIKQHFRRAENFAEKAQDPEFVSSMEETSHGFQIAFLIRENINQINRFRFLLLSNARLASRLSGVESRIEDGRTHSYQVLDFGRYFDIHSSRTGQEPVEVDIESLNDKGLACLPAHAGTNEYESYLVALPGTLLAKIYSEYGARLLEQNVRTFLQARGKVNRGIINTIKNCPEMFFAYNNGLTATAAEIRTEQGSDGTPEITSISNFQIVNGGQTTASMLYARDKERCDLSQVFVQMKLSVVSPDFIEEVVPNISRFANTQNRVSEADFFSNHPFHVRIEEFSRRIMAPVKEGQFNPSKWFYERARGQYRDGQAYLTDARRRQYVTQFPKNQVITKTDLAKYEVTFQCEPHTVSAGAQKNFLKFAETIAQIWGKDEKQINEEYYRSLVAKAIIFRTVDKMVMKAPWYQGGYKANIVTYSIAWLVNHVRTELQSELDFERIWKLQDLPPNLLGALETVAEQVAGKIEQTPDTIRNVTEWCKRQACWHGVSKMEVTLPGDLKNCIVDKAESKQRVRDAAKTQDIDNAVKREALIVTLGPRWEEIRNFAIANRCLGGDRIHSAISRVMRGNMPNQPQMRALNDLLKRVEDKGYDISDAR
jgi:hypothetical protein